MRLTATTRFNYKKNFETNINKSIFLTECITNELRNNPTHNVTKIDMDLKFLTLKPKHEKVIYEYWKSSKAGSLSRMDRKQPA